MAAHSAANSTVQPSLIPPPDSHPALSRIRQVETSAVDSTRQGVRDVRAPFIDSRRTWGNFWAKLAKAVWRLAMRTLRSLGLALFCLIMSTAAYAQTAHLSAAEAKNHIGEKATVCGKVVSARFAGRSRGQPTFLNLDKPYPNQIFTIVIWGSDRPKFGDAESKYSDKNVCVTGRITSYRDIPEIAANDPSQIELSK
jgi:hypothetical protein